MLKVDGINAKATTEVLQYSKASESDVDNTRQQTKSPHRWFKEVKKNLEVVGVDWAHVPDRSVYRLTANNFKGFHSE